MADRSPAAWLDLLERRLHDRWAEWSVYDAYYEGDHRLSGWLRSVRRAFSGTVLGTLLDQLTNNYMQLVVDSAAERLKVQGFRIVGETKTDDEASKIWRTNGLKNQSGMLHTESVKLGEAYWLIEPRGEGKIPRVTCEHPSQVIVSCAPGDRLDYEAALKEWSDGGYTFANVYLPDRVVKYRTKERNTRQRSFTQLETVPNSLGEVPFAPLPNNPSMLEGGRSDLSFGAVSLQDQAEKSAADLLIGGEYHGLPQRVLLGVEAPRDENGRVIPFEQALKSKLWYFNNENAKAHEFSQADLQGLRETIDGFIGDLAAQTRIPIYYFRPQAISNISAEALVGLDAGLVSKAKDKEDPFEEGHNRMMRLSSKAMGREKEFETIWANTESRSHAQVVDAAIKKQALGVPFEQIMEDIGYTPDQIDRMASQRETDSLLTLTQPALNGNGSVPAVPSAN